MLLRDDKRAEALGLTGIGGFTAVDHRRVCADLRAVALMGDRDLWLNHDRRIVGPIAKESDDYPADWTEPAEKQTMLDGRHNKFFIANKV
ncbi:hypothetical protein E2562_015357 [Oryza meyeriana var. granulata]|uniref:Uncharacterized protein n=1 Tax=Oryza meyeriana var. granulata TaxID=110450 RepID=A0A6G1EKC7_9ORYZ|nr:hypothetical protein E2562_015357 [Oryza meyeriana var. granulata]